MSNPAYKPVSVRATGAPEADTGVVLLALDVAGRNWADALRLSLSLEEAEAIAMALIGDAAIQRHKQAIQRHRLICEVA